MAIPLVMLGPGGDYTTRYQIKGQSLVRAEASLEQQPDTETAGSMAGWDRFPGHGEEDDGGAADAAGLAGLEGDCFEHVAPDAGAGTYDADGRLRAGALAGPIQAALLAWLAEQHRVLTGQFDAVRRMGRAPAAGTRTAGQALPDAQQDDKERDHEPHAQTTAHPHPHPRSAPGARLFTDDAGARRRAWRQQGHGLRAGRSADQKRRFGAPAQQGSLFGA